VVCAVLDGLPVPLPWETVTSSELHGPWAGIRPLGTGDLFGRWLWDVVETGGPDLDDLALTVAQDVVRLTVHDGGDRRFDTVVAVKRCPPDLSLPASALPPPPWWVEWSTGWSTQVLHGAAQAWLARQGLRTSLMLPVDATNEAGADVVSLTAVDDGTSLSCTGSVFGELLRLPLEDAAALSVAFQALLDDLADRQCL
jgi:hypothetical protein